VVLEKLAYTLLNPVRAGLVGRARAWGGATSAVMRFGGRRLIARPSEFFSEDMPPCFSLYPDFRYEKTSCRYPAYAVRTRCLPVRTGA
jgi:hypothetical protein